MTEDERKQAVGEFTEALGQAAPQEISLILDDSAALALKTLQRKGYTPEIVALAAGKNCRGNFMIFGGGKNKNYV